MTPPLSLYMQRDMPRHLRHGRLSIMVWSPEIDAQSRESTGPLVGWPAKYNTLGEYAGRVIPVLTRDQPPGFRPGLGRWD